MKAIDLCDISIKGELAVRSGLNFSRLEGMWYRPDEVFDADQHGWPGDWEGRIILALTLLSQSTHRVPAYLDEIVSLIPEHLNEKEYLGNILPEGRFDEQQLAGNSWFLRGMIEYYKIKKDEKVKGIIESIVRNLLLPSKGCYHKYPATFDERMQENDTWVLSRLQTKTKNHAGTSDAGCCFIMLDGATAAYEFLGWPELKELIEEMIDKFLSIDLDNSHIQTHATLSATRGILRFYELTNDMKYLESAINKFEFYKTEAWTEAYGNYNWFGIPKWTEPCAIIDSFIVAVGLWKVTGVQKFLEDAHRIYYNAICHSQRSSGALGTDICAGAADAEDRLNLYPLTFEVYWCCTMRGGECFTRAIEYNFFIEGSRVYIPFYNNCTAVLEFDDGKLELEEEVKYPYYGDISFKVLEKSTVSSKQFYFFVPSWTNENSIKVYINGNPVASTYSNCFIRIAEPLEPGDRIEFDLGMSVRAEKAAFKNSVKGYHKFFYGPMLLGCKGVTGEEVKLPENAKIERIGRSEFGVENRDIVLSSLCDVKDLTQIDTKRQVLFMDEQ